MQPQEPAATAAQSSPGNEGVALLVIGVGLILAHALLILNAFRNAEIVSLSLAIILVIFGYDLVKKGMGRLGYGDKPQAVYYQPYYAYGYYAYQPNQQAPYAYPQPQMPPQQPREPPRESAGAYADRAAQAPRVVR